MPTQAAASGSDYHDSSSDNESTSSDDSIAGKNDANVQEDRRQQAKEEERESWRKRREVINYSLTKYIGNRKGRGKPEPASLEDYYDSSKPEVGFEFWIGYLERFVQGSIGVISDRPNVQTVKLRIGDVWKLYQRNREIRIPTTARKPVMNHVRGHMVRNGLVSKEKKRRYFTDSRGLRELSRATWSEKYAVIDNRYRVLDALWLNSQEQTGNRSAATFCSAKATGFATYRNYQIIVQKSLIGRSENLVLLVKTKSNYKTKLDKNGEDLLQPMDELWRCPVFMFFWNAHMDNALPYSYDELLDPAFLSSRSTDSVNLTAKTECLYMPVFPMSGEDTVRPWNYDIITGHLKKLSMLAGFEVPLSTHSFRRMVAIFMRATGWSIREGESDAS